MQPRIPRQSPRDPAAHGTDGDPRLGAEAAAALAAARRRAIRDGDRQVDTAHLLHSLLEHDPEVRAAFGGGFDGGPRLARLLGYLVQRSIGYGLRWQGGVEESAAPSDGPQGGTSAPADIGRTGGAPAVAPVEGPSPLAAAAVEQACARAVRHARAPARGVDLLAAIVADPRARAVEVLVRAGADVPGLRTRLEESPQEREACLDGGSAR